jgi:hypothetical protein
MARGWTRRATSAPHALAIAGTVLALAALGQAIARAVPLVTAGEAPITVPLCLLALATTVPLIFLRPAVAAIAIAAASAVSVTVFSFDALTVAGIAAQVLASYRLGYEGVSRDAGLTRDDKRDPLPSWPAGWPCSSWGSRSPGAAGSRSSCWPR